MFCRFSTVSSWSPARANPGPWIIQILLIGHDQMTRACYRSEVGGAHLSLRHKRRKAKPSQPKIDACSCSTPPITIAMANQLCSGSDPELKGRTSEKVTQCPGKSEEIGATSPS